MSEPNSAVLRVRTGPLAGPLLTRVVGMMLARAECPVDRLDDAMLICDALGARACEHAADGHIEFTVRTRAGDMELRVGALASGGAQRLIEATALPGIGAVIEPIADRVAVEASAVDAGEELVLTLGFGSRLASRASGDDLDLPPRGDLDSPPGDDLDLRPRADLDSPPGGDLDSPPGRDLHRPSGEPAVAKLVDQAPGD